MAGGKYSKSSKRPQSAKALSQKQKQSVKTIAQKVIQSQSEWKHYTYGLTTSVSDTGFVSSKTEVPQGDTDVTRDGDMIQVSSLSYRYSVTAGDTENLVRVIFFQWHSSLAVPGVTNILNIAAGYETLSMYEVDQAGHEFKILYDRTHALNINYASGVDQRVFTGKLQIPRKKVQFRGGGLNGSNKIWCLMISDSNAITHPQIKMVTKLNYMDN